MKTLRVGIAQMNSCVGDFQGNQKKMQAYVDKATHSDCDLVVFPELALCGYPPEDLILRPRFRKDSLFYAHEVSRSITGDLVALYGFVDNSLHHTYNASAIAFHKTIQGIYHKMQLPNYGVFDEKRYFCEGGHYSVVDLNGIRIGITICEDIWGGEDICRTYSSLAQVDVLVNISASPYHAGKLTMRLDFVKRLAQRTHMHFCYANLVGGQDELVFDGGSFICDEKGRCVAMAKEFEEDFLVYDIKVREKTSTQRENGFKRDTSQGGKKIESYVFSTHQKKYRVLKVHKTSKLSRVEEIYSALVLGLRDYVKKNGFQKVILGLSGGVDSALVCALAVDALGKENVNTLSLPSVFSSSHTQQDAACIAERLGVSHRVIPIQPLYEMFLHLLDPVFQGTGSGIAEQNIQARIRGILLMAFSNKFGWLVLSTGNKSEMAVGYATLYGDMAGGFAVLKDVPKQWVYALVRYRNEKTKTAVIPRSVIVRAPTAELKYNQKDEDDIPAYPVLDKVLDQYVEKDKSCQDIIRAGFKSQEVKKIISLIDANEYKRRQAPLGIRITPKAFGKDRRMPITNKYKG